jgi:hypothetical protein
MVLTTVLFKLAGGDDRPSSEKEEECDRHLPSKLGKMEDTQRLLSDLGFYRQNRERFGWPARDGSNKSNWVCCRPLEDPFFGGENIRSRLTHIEYKQKIKMNDEEDV